MKKYLAMVLLASLPLFAEEKCNPEALYSYFPREFVANTLEKFHVPEDQREAIEAALVEKDKKILDLVDAKASKMDPNPLKRPVNRKETVRLFRETLEEQFGEVLGAYGINDPEKVKHMLDDVQYQKAKRIVECRSNPTLM